MKARLLIAVVAVLGYAILDGPTANAANRHFDNNGGIGNGLWSEAINWDATDCNSGGVAAVPKPGDHAIICANQDAYIMDENAVALKVTVRSGAVIYIDPETADATLTLGSSGGDDTSTLEGTGSQIVLMLDNVNPQNPKLVATLKFAASEDHVFTRTGNIEGRDSDAQILIEDGRSLTIDDAYNGGDYANKVSIVGQLRIVGVDEGDGYFHNDGRVEANTSGTLDIAITNGWGSVTDTANSGACSDGTPEYRWGVTNASATLRFLLNMECNDDELLGDFFVTTGVLRFGDSGEDDDIDMDTVGDLCQSGGEIIVGQNDSADFSVACE